MKSLSETIGAAVGIVCLLAGCAGMSTGNTGKQEFESKCAACHGVSGKGDGPQAMILPKKPANLTLLAKENGGVFPAVRVHEIIDGRLEVIAHGPRTMPVWGEEFLKKESSDHLDVSAETFTYRENRVNARVQALVDYLKQIQEK